MVEALGDHSLPEGVLAAVIAAAGLRPAGAASAPGRFVARGEWGARPPRSRTALRATFGVTGHWEGPGLGPYDHAACASMVREIQQFHMDTRGWVDIAYQAALCRHGYVYEGRWIGVRSAANGTNAGNDTSYAVCILMGEGDTLTAEALGAWWWCVETFRAAGAGPGLRGHRDWRATSCPGDAFYAAIGAGAPPTPVPVLTKEDDMPPRSVSRQSAPGGQHVVIGGRAQPVGSEGELIRLAGAGFVATDKEGRPLPPAVFPDAEFDAHFGAGPRAALARRRVRRAARR